MSQFAETSVRERTGGKEAGPRRDPHRRILSVLFCDLVESTALSRRIDPEDLRIALKSYQDQARSAIEQFGGFFGRLLGDGALAYFGWPHAQEDQAAQAVRAGLELVRTISSLTFGAGQPAQCRVGIATGRVVIGDDTDPDLAFGDTLNLAARLQSIAAPNQVVIDDATYRWIGRRFSVVQLDPARLKGFADPVASWAVLEERRALDRFDARPRGRAEFSGRAEELGQLEGLWQSVLSGDGRVAVLCGTAGIGKSRLVREFCAQVAADKTVLRFQCSAHHVGSGFHPVIEALAGVAGIKPGEDPAPALRRVLDAILSRTPRSESTDVASVGLTLGLAPAEDVGEAPSSARERRAQAIGFIVRSARRMAREQPILIAIEDIHWIDPSTLELLQALVAALQGARIMVVATTRHRVGSLAALSEVNEILLDPVPNADAERIVRSITGSERLSGREISLIVSRADGIPLFAEELTTAAIQHGQVTRFDDLPQTVEASLTARLDLLSHGKAVAQVASVLGREFGFGELEALAGASVQPDDLRAGLGELMAAGLALPVGRSDDGRYRFSHALVQEVAYASLLRRSRQRLHERAARHALPDEVRTRQPELVARHLTEAGLIDEAIDHWKLAGARAAETSANAEAISHFRTGLSLIETLPDEPSRDARTFSFLVALSGPLIAEFGYTSAELEHCITHAMSLSERIGDTPEIYSLLYARWAFLLTSGSIAESLQVALDFSGLAERQRHADACFARHRMLGASYMCLGELSTASSELEELLRGYDRERHAHLVHSYGVDLLVAGLCFKSEVMWLMGDVEDARASAAKALAEARGTEHVNSIAMALHFCGLIAFLNRDPDGVRAHAREMGELAARQPAGAWPILTTAMEGWAILADGRWEDGMTMLTEGIDRARAVGVLMFLAILHCRVAEVLIEHGQPGAAAPHVSAAEALTADAGERNYRAEVLRLQGVLLSASARAGEAETHLRRALAIARGQGARSLELRAATSYAEVLRRRGDAAGTEGS